MIDEPGDWQALIEGAYECWRDERYNEALQLCDRAAHLGPPALYAAAMLRGDILLEVGDPAGALSSFDTIADPSIPDPDLDCARGQALFQMARFAEADNALRSALRGRPELAEAHYTVGVIAEILGTGEEVERFRAARKLDPKNYPATPRLSTRGFEDVVESVVESLPEKIAHVLEDLPILIAEMPHPDDLRRAQPNLPPTSFGAFVGLSTKSNDGYATESEQKPAILLFKRNIERVSPTPDKLRHNLRRTLLAELGQALGMSEEELGNVLNEAKHKL